MAGRNLYTYLGDLGFTGAYEERVRAALTSAITTGGGTVSQENTTNDMWMIYGALSFPSAPQNINDIQRAWAASLGVPMGDYNDMFNNL